jgi:hypothetical protein
MVLGLEENLLIYPKAELLVYSAKHSKQKLRN